MAATLLADRSKIKPAWYGLASIVAASRIHVRIHHASDVVVGAGLGLALGRLARKLVPLR
jgi:undecaprenyl-diphosphatase